MTTRRGIALVLLLIGAAVFVSGVGVLLAYLLAGRGPTVAEGSTLLVRVSGVLEDVEPRGILGQLLRPRPSVRSIAETLRLAKADPRIAGLILVPTAPSALWGKIQEVRDAVLDFRRSGKPAVAYLEVATEREYYLATACDRIYLAPASPLNLTGLAMYELFVRDLLDKVGVVPDLVRAGEYKTAPNTFTERGFTRAHREMLDAITADLWAQLVEGIAEGRRKSVAEVRQLLDRGPLLPQAAVDAGLVDGLAYEDELGDKAKLGGRELSIVEQRQYRGRGLEGVDFGGKPRIAVIYGGGLIVAGESRFEPPGEGLLGSRTIGEALRRARDDGTIRAVVLRIDSPGGSFVASDVIWREVWLTRRAKPLIVSMADVAASGGYYLAMPATRIVAQPGTLTGSIGVYAGKFAVGGALDKLGVRVDSVTQGRWAEMYSPIRPFTPAERARLDAQVQAVYETFVAKAAEARGRAPEEIKAIAGGRVFTGRQAKRLGLVDDLGGLDRAVALAKEHAGIPATAEVDLVIYPERRGLRNWLSALAGRLEQTLAEWVGLTGPAAAAWRTMPVGVFRQGEVLAVMPLLLLR